MNSEQIRLIELISFITGDIRAKYATSFEIKNDELRIYSRFFDGIYMRNKIDVLPWTVQFQQRVKNVLINDLPIVMKSVLHDVVVDNIEMLEGEVQLNTDKGPRFFPITDKFLDRYCFNLEEIAE